MVVAVRQPCGCATADAWRRGRGRRPRLRARARRADEAPSSRTGVRVDPRPLPGPRRLRRTRRPEVFALDRNRDEGARSRRDAGCPIRSAAVGRIRGATAPRSALQHRRSRYGSTRASFRRNVREMTALSARRDGRDGAPLGRRQRRGRPHRRLVEDVAVLHRGRDLQLEQRIANWEFVARGRQQIHDWAFGHRDGGPRALDLSLRAHARRRREGRVPRHLAPDRAGRRTRTGNPTRSRARAARGSATRATIQWSWQRDFFDHMPTRAPCSARWRRTGSSRRRCIESA